VTASSGSPFRLVVVGVDGSDAARRAVEWTADLAAATDAEVVAAHVLTYDREFERDLTLDTMRTWRRELERDLRDVWTEPLRALPVRFRSILVEATSPSIGLLEVAEREHADLVVVGARGQGHLAGRVIGGLSYRLGHHATQPVVVVPPHWRRRDVPAEPVSS
jgi:nucleotide-binding universal stress UspA family protein